MNCKKCGNIINPNEKSCPICGEPIMNMESTIIENQSNSMINPNQTPLQQNVEQPNFMSQAIPESTLNQQGTMNQSDLQQNVQQINQLPEPTPQQIAQQPNQIPVLMPQPQVIQPSSSIPQQNIQQSNQTIQPTVQPTTYQNPNTNQFNQQLPANSKSNKMFIIIVSIIVALIIGSSALIVYKVISNNKVEQKASNNNESKNDNTNNNSSKVDNTTNSTEDTNKNVNNSNIISLYNYDFNIPKDLVYEVEDDIVSFHNASYTYDVMMSLQAYSIDEVISSMSSIEDSISENGFLVLDSGIEKVNTRKLVIFDIFYSGISLIMGYADFKSNVVATFNVEASSQADYKLAYSKIDEILNSNSNTEYNSLDAPLKTNASITDSFKDINTSSLDLNGNTSAKYNIGE